jgi:mitochondrial import receptor subunit TOM22
VPPQTRSYIAGTVSSAGDAVKSVLSFGGKTLWIISSSALLLGIPWALAWSEETQVLDMEKEMKMREMGGDVSYVSYHFYGRQSEKRGETERDKSLRDS